MIPKNVNIGTLHHFLATSLVVRPYHPPQRSVKYTPLNSQRCSTVDDNSLRNIPLPVQLVCRYHCHLALLFTPAIIRSVQAAIHPEDSLPPIRPIPPRADHYKTAHSCCSVTAPLPQIVCVACVSFITYLLKSNTKIPSVSPAVRTSRVSQTVHNMVSV